MLFLIELLCKMFRLLNIRAQGQAASDLVGSREELPFKQLAVAELEMGNCAGAGRYRYWTGGGFSFESKNHAKVIFLKTEHQLPKLFPYFHSVLVSGICVCSKVDILPS